MGINLWVFLSITLIVSLVFVFSIVSTVQRNKRKILEIEALKTSRAEWEAELESSIKQQLANHLVRIQTLEAIVTDKNYDLNEKISNL